jgi:hypothetical protein
MRPAQVRYPGTAAIRHNDGLTADDVSAPI